MLTSVPINNSLLPFTRLTLIVSAVVQLVVGLVCILLPDLWNGFFWPDPLPPFTDVGLKYGGIIYLGTAVAALYALAQGTWQGARVYFAFSFPYIIMAMILTLFMITTYGAPLIVWLYLFLSALYLPVVAYVWYHQSKVGSPAYGGT